MIIGATKKAQPLFSAFTTIKDKEHGKQFAQANPLFSWHANYINVNRKKVLILLNDQTYTPIILQDINAQKRKQLPELIPEAIRLVFELAGISNEKTEEYLKLAGDIQITATSNRSLLGSVNLVAEELSSSRLDISQTINIEEMTFYSDYIHTRLFKQGYGSSAKALKDAMNKPLKLEEVSEAEPYAIEKTWDYNELTKVDVLDLSEQQREKYQTALLENNEKLLDAFKRYLVDKKGLGEKTVKRHIEHLYFYVNIYLAEYEMVTPINSGDSVDYFLGDFFTRKNLLSSRTSLKQNGSALKRLYQFLFEAGEISKKDLIEIHESIQIGVQEGEEYMMDDDIESWF